MTLSQELGFDQWKALGATIGRYASASSWWLGDWLTFGQRRYGERYREGIDHTGLEYQTLRNYAVVARRFPPSRRRTDLSFQHHAEVCSLSDEDQNFWLDLAADRNWSRTELRRRVRASRGRARPLIVPAVLRLVLDAERRQRWDEAAQRSRRDLESWATRALDEAAAAALASDVAIAVGADTASEEASIDSWRPVMPSDHGGDRAFRHGGREVSRRRVAVASPE